MLLSRNLAIGPLVVEVKIEESYSLILDTYFENFLTTKEAEAKIVILEDASLKAPELNAMDPIDILTSKMNDFVLETHSSFSRAKFDFSKKEALAYFSKSDPLSDIGVLMYIQLISSILLLDHNCLLMHGAGIIHNKEGYLFSGPCNSGKTTLSKKAEKEGLLLLGDDCVGLDAHNNTLFSTFFKNPFDNLEVSFSHCFFIEQGDNLTKQVLTKKQFMYKLLKNNHLFLYLKEEAKPFIGKLIKLSNTVVKNNDAKMLYSRLEDDILEILK